MDFGDFANRYQLIDATGQAQGLKVSNTIEDLFLTFKVNLYFTSPSTKDFDL